MSNLEIPDVAIIVPCKNAENYILKGIESLVNQSYKNIEIIIVDDGSSDSSVELVKNRFHHDARVFVIKNSGVGANSARKNGVLYSRAPYTMFMDDDDEWLAHGVEIMYRSIISNGCDLVCCNAIDDISSENIRFIYSSINKKIETIASPDLILDVPPSFWAKIFKKNILKDIEFDDLPYAQDWNVTYKYLAIIDSFMFLNDALYFYKRRPSSHTSLEKNSDFLKIVNANKSIDKVVEYVKNNKINKNYPIFSIKIDFYTNQIFRSYCISSVNERKLFFQEVNNSIKLKDLILNVKSISINKRSAKLFYTFFAAKSFIFYELSRWLNIKKVNQSILK